MGESIVQVTEGSGKKLHTWQRTVGANSVEDEFTIPGEYPLASYIAAGVNTSTGTANDHLLQVMAGASLNVRVRRIRLAQAGLVTSAANVSVSLYRLTSAGTGGTAITPSRLDTADAASGATAMTLPTVKGAESTLIFTRRAFFTQTSPAGGLAPNAGWEWVQLPGSKPLIIPAGAANGIALKLIAAYAGATVDIEIEFTETSFL